MFRDHREWMKHGHYGHAGMNFANNQQQSESEDGFLRSDNTFGAVIAESIQGWSAVIGPYLRFSEYVKNTMRVLSLANIHVNTLILSLMPRKP